MRQAKPPFKLAIALVFLDGTPRSLDTLMDTLELAYANEKICTRAIVEANLQSLKAVGILSAESHKGDSTFYRITDYGRQRVTNAL